MNNEVSKYVGSKIRDFRKKKGLTQKELGEMIGVKHNTISSYEKATNEPEQNALYSIANVLGISINDFFPSKYDVSNQDAAPKMVREQSETYSFIPQSISAGLPLYVDGMTKTDEIELPDVLLGKWAGNKDLFIMKVNGDSMNKVIPDKSLIAVKPVELHKINQGDIVVYSNDGGDYSVKRFYKNEDNIIFRPDSHDDSFFEQAYQMTDHIKIHGKVVVYIVELD